MQTKLTLTINKSVIEKAKVHARQSGTSLSAMVENYLRLATTGVDRSSENDILITPGVAKLRGVAKLPEQDTTSDPKVEWLDYLSEKHR